jgi:rhodanese-related sulfurtransferase
MKQLILFLAMVLLPILINAQQTLDPKFEKKIEGLIEHSVPIISCERLEQKMKTANLYLLDAREQSEYEISHLEDAIWVGYNTFSPDNLAAVPKDGIVVVYCSVGYRSEKIGEKLKKMGYSRVYNLYGGIFEWANRTYPLVDNKNEKTDKVHAYNQDWGRWLNKGEKVYK